MTEHVTTATVSTRELAGGTVAVLSLDNGEERRPNTFGEQGLASLSAALDEVERLVEDGEVRGVVVVGKPGSFLAGADLTHFAAITDADEAYRFSSEGKRQFARLQALGVPTVAILTGMALGGGLELALYCDARVALTDAKFVGLPEAFLGLVPGWSGSVHLPQLIGPERALGVLVDKPLAGNRLTKIAEAAELGIVDEVADDMDGAWEAAGRLLAAVPERADHTADAQAWQTALDARRPAAQARQAAGSSALGLLLELVEGARTATARDLAHRESAISRDVTMSDANRRNLYAFRLLGARGEAPASDARIVEVLGAATRALPAAPAGLTLGQVRESAPALRTAVRTLLDEGQEPARIDTVALKELGWPPYFGGILPVLDAVAAGEGLPEGEFPTVEAGAGEASFLPRGVATVPTR